MIPPISLRPSRAASRLGRPLIACLLFAGSTAAGTSLAQIEFEPAQADAVSGTPDVTSPEQSSVPTIHALTPELNSSAEPPHQEIQAAWPPQPLALLVDPWPEPKAEAVDVLSAQASSLTTTRQASSPTEPSQLEVTSVDEFEDPWQSPRGRIASPATAADSSETWLD